MFRLTGEIRRDDGRIGRAVGNDHRLGRSSDHVDADAAEQHALGLGDIIVAGADDDVGGMAREIAIGKRRHALHAAEREHRIGAGQSHGVKDRGIDALVALGRRRRDDVFNARRFCRAHAHNRGRGMGVSPTGHVASGGRHRHETLADDQAVERFGFKRLLGVPLANGKVPDPGVGKPQIILDGLRQGLLRVAKPVLGNDNVAVPAIELARIIARGVLAARLDFSQHLRHHPRRVGVGVHRLLQGPLEIALPQFGLLT